MLYFFAPDASADDSYGNPASIHWAGRKAKAAIDEAREAIARAFGIASEEEIVFTGSGTEAVNAALKGAYFHAVQAGKRFHLITSAVEHEATLETARFLESLGARAYFLEVDRDGQLSETQLENLLASLATDPENFTVVSLMAANNETGVVFPIRRIGKKCQRYHALFHVDAVQAIGKLETPFSVGDSLAQLVSFSAHKIGGPKGIGALYIQRGLKLVSLLHGGAQERRRRAGTQNVAGIVGFGKAAALLDPEETARMKELRDYLEAEVERLVPDVRIQGKKSPRLVNTSNLLFRGVRGDSLLMSLDLEGIAVSTGSACASGTVNPSHVLLAMGFDKEEAKSAIRISLGAQNTRAEVDHFLSVLPQLVERIRAK